VDCLQLVATFPDGAKLLASVERLQLEGILSKRRSSPYRSGECRDWRKIKTAAWREANRSGGGCLSEARPQSPRPRTS
jgi:ATP-dependent DNA ligase